MPFSDYARLMRPVNCFMASIGVLVGFISSASNLYFDYKLVLAMLAAFLVCAAGQAVNDYFDARIDAQKKTGKPIPTGRIKPQNALFFSLCLFALGVFFSFFVNMSAFMIAAVFSVLLFFYSWKMSKAKFVGNIVVALGTAFTVVFGAAINNEYSIAVFFAASAFFANAGREITKDIEDKKIDKGVKITLAQVFPHGVVCAVVLASYALASAVALSLWTNGAIKSSVFFALILLSSALFLAAWHFALRHDPVSSQGLSKAAMFISLIAFVAWRLV